MSMQYRSKKKVILVVCLFLVALIIGYAKIQSKIITSYSAKAMASGIFVSHRDSADIADNELDYSLIKYASNSIDYNKKEVTSTILGVSPTTVQYREDIGCTILKNKYQKLIPVSIHHKKSSSPYLNGNVCTTLEGVNYTKLDSAIDLFFSSTQKTAAVVVVYKNRLIGEKYDCGATSSTPLWGWSMNKSILSALFGIASDRGLLDITQPVTINSWKHDPRNEITINHLLQMSSGLEWDEDYFRWDKTTQMIFGGADCVNEAIDAPYEHKPGTYWQYSSGTTNILSGILRETLKNDSTYWDFPSKELFEPLGMNSMVWETDPYGNYIASSFGYATARDWARFGLLYLNEGKVENKQIVSSDWVKYSHTPCAASKGYGAQFWLNADHSLPDVPQDMYAAHGHRGQRVYIVPSKELVVVRLGFSQTDVDFNKNLSSIIEAISQ